MATYRARLLDSLTGNEGAYEFEDREELMAGPADDVVHAFFLYAERALFRRDHVQYELNGVVKNAEQNTVVAIGQMYMLGDEDRPSTPFTLFIGQAP